MTNDFGSLPRSARAVRDTPYYADEFVTLYHGDNRAVLPSITMPELLRFILARVLERIGIVSLPPISTRKNCRR